jgi:hypothetical protein
VIFVDSSAWAWSSCAQPAARPTCACALRWGTEPTWRAPDVIVMEILAGARDDADRVRLRRLLFGLDFLRGRRLLAIARHAPLRLASLT